MKASGGSLVAAYATGAGSATPASRHVRTSRPNMRRGLASGSVLVCAGHGKYFTSTIKYAYPGWLGREWSDYTGKCLVSLPEIWYLI